MAQWAPAAGDRHFAGKAAWETHLKALGITGERQVSTATEGALLGSLIAHGVSPDLVIRSDDAGQFAILVRILAVKDLATAIELNPAYLLAYESRARAYEKLGDKEKAAADAAKAAELKKGAKK